MSNRFVRDANCKDFYFCQYPGQPLRTHHWTCGQGTLFNEDLLTCDYDYKVPCPALRPALRPAPCPGQSPHTGGEDLDDDAETLDVETMEMLMHGKKIICGSATCHVAEASRWASDKMSLDQ